MENKKFREGLDLLEVKYISNYINKSNGINKFKYICNKYLKLYFLLMFALFY